MLDVFDQLFGHLTRTDALIDPAANTIKNTDEPAASIYQIGILTFLVSLVEVRIESGS